jgi:hypothetical protein
LRKERELQITRREMASASSNQARPEAEAFLVVCRVIVVAVTISALLDLALVELLSFVRALRSYWQKRRNILLQDEFQVQSFLLTQLFCSSVVFCVTLAMLYLPAPGLSPAGCNALAILTRLVSFVYQTIEAPITDT